MTKDELYRKLIDTHHRHQSKNTLCKTYTDQVIKLVKEYLTEKESATVEIDQTVKDYWAKEIKKHMHELNKWKNKQWNY